VFGKCADLGVGQAAELKNESRKTTMNARAAIAVLAVLWSGGLLGPAFGQTEIASIATDIKLPCMVNNEHKFACEVTSGTEVNASAGGKGLAFSQVRQLEIAYSKVAPSNGRSIVFIQYRDGNTDSDQKIAVLYIGPTTCVRGHSIKKDPTVT